MIHIPILAQPSLLSWPFCGRLAWSDHHNRTAYDRNVSFLVRTEMPEDVRLKLYEKGLAIYLSGLVLCDFVLSMLLAGLALAVGLSRLWNVDL